MARAYNMARAPSHRRIKNCVRELYAKLATYGTANISAAPVASGEKLARALGYDTSALSIPKEAWELFAGCGNPLTEIKLEPHWIVLDLGCGVGIDSQVAALALQSPGMVLSMDITKELLDQAKEYSSPYSVCHWLVGDGELLPLLPESADLVVANGSFNLMPRKDQALAEIYQVLKPGGYLALADLILVGEMEPIDEGYEEAWAWCVAGAITANEYNGLLESRGFSWWRLKEKSCYGPLAAAHLLAQKGGSD